MKQNVKITSVVLSSLIILMLALVGCEKDIVEPIETQETFLKGLHRTTFSNVKSSKLISNNTERFIKSKNEFNRIHSDSVLFTIDTTEVQIIQTSLYDSYTFLVNSDYSNQDVLRNYVLTVYSDTLVKQMLVTYPIVLNEFEIL